MLLFICLGDLASGIFEVNEEDEEDEVEGEIEVEWGVGVCDMVNINPFTTPTVWVTLTTDGDLPPDWGGFIALVEDEEDGDEDEEDDENDEEEDEDDDEVRVLEEEEKEVVGTGINSDHWQLIMLLPSSHDLNVSASFVIHR